VHTIHDHFQSQPTLLTSVFETTPENSRRIDNRPAFWNSSQGIEENGETVMIAGI
jgi:hypothetical protein